MGLKSLIYMISLMHPTENLTTLKRKVSYHSREICAANLDWQLRERNQTLNQPFSDVRGCARVAWPDEKFYDEEGGLEAREELQDSSIFDDIAVATARAGATA
jgi:hypothetical protein